MEAIFKTVLCISLLLFVYFVYLGKKTPEKN